MRMGFGVFIGILIILFGVGIIVNVIFHVQIPVFKILVGIFLIYLGLRIIFGNWLFWGSHHWRSGDAVFHHRVYRGLSGDSTEYSAVFGKAVVDLRDIKLKEKITRVKVNAVFGGAEVILNPETPVRINAEAVFGGVRMPENMAGGLGSSYYQSKNFDETKNHLIVDATSVFGGMRIHY